MTGPDVVARYGLSRQGANNVIKALLVLGILEKVRMRTRKDVDEYWSPEIVKVLAG